jgi:hypothetical protein
MSVVGPRLKEDLIFLQMEDDLNLFTNGRQPQFFYKWKTTSILLHMEDDVNFSENGRQLQSEKWKTT